MASVEVMAGAAVVTGAFGVVGWLLRRTVERVDQQAKDHADLRGDVGVIRTALVGIDGRNGLRSTVTALAEDVKGLRDDVRTVLTATAERPAVTPAKRRRAS